MRDKYTGKGMKKRAHRIESGNKPETCPACGASIIAEILYEMVACSDELEQDIDSGRIILGGCCLTGDDPVWECTQCG